MEPGNKALLTRTLSLLGRIMDISLASPLLLFNNPLNGLLKLMRRLPSET
jgi:hypothetical protein